MRRRMSGRPGGLSDNVRIALIGAVAVVAASVVTGTAALVTQRSAQRAALDQQRLSLAQQRKLADRDELRRRLDDAAGALDGVMTDSDHLFHAWRDRRRRIKFPTQTPKLVRDMYRSGKALVRLGLRLKPRSQVLLTYRNVLGYTQLSAVVMSRYDSYTRGVVLNVQQLRGRATESQGRFTEDARRILDLENRLASSR